MLSESPYVEVSWKVAVESHIDLAKKRSPPISKDPFRLDDASWQPLLPAMCRCSQ